MYLTITNPSFVAGNINRHPQFQLDPIGDPHAVLACLLTNLISNSVIELTVFTAQ